MSLEFKKLEVSQSGSWLVRMVKSKHTQKTIRYVLIGALISFIFFYLSEGREMDVIHTKDVLKSMLVGGFFGFFITNSPCARGKC